MVEGIYFFGDQVRWNLGWANPNQAGAFLICFIPLLWGLQGLSTGFEGNRVRLFSNALFFAMEAALWFLLCKTYSRGAFVAIAGAGIVYFIWTHLIAITPKRAVPIPAGRQWIIPALRIVVVVSLLVLTGFIGRIDPEFVSQDASAGNRLVLWEGGVKMIAAAPWTGWGVDQSGLQFMHWFQPLDAKEAYAGMVNSYLHFSVERGLPLLAVAMTVFMGLVLLPLFAVPNRLGRLSEIFARNKPPQSGVAGDSALPARDAFIRAMLPALSASLLAFLFANVFSTLWIFPGLWWLPAIVSVLILLLAFLALGDDSAPKALARTFTLSFLLVSVALAGLIVIGKSRDHGVAVEFTRTGVWLGEANSEENTGATLILPDATVLGEDYGKEIRRLVLHENWPPARVFVPRYRNGKPTGPIEPNEFETVIACGARAAPALERFNNAEVPGDESKSTHLIILHPLRKPAETAIKPNSPGSEITIVLPFVDLTGAGRHWKRAARAHDWKVRSNPGVAQDIRAIWPDCLIPHLKAESAQE